MCGHHVEEYLLEPFNKANRAIFELVTPSLDVYWLEDTPQRGHKIIVHADLAGFTADKIDVTLEGNILTIEAIRDPIEDTTDGKKNDFRKIFNDRPEKINKKIILPFNPENGGKGADLQKPKYNGNDGVLKIEIGNIKGIKADQPT